MNSTNEVFKFRENLAKNGIIGYSPDKLEYLYNVAKICARTAGIPAAGATAVMAAGVGSVTIPGVGAVPGWVAGALAGFVSGTVSCTIMRVSFKEKLDELYLNH
jgi:hypothetical protein